MDLTAEELADRLLPLDGPHDPDAVVETAHAIAELVRRLNHATFHRTALRYPSQLYRVVGSLNAAGWGLEQLLRQLANHAERFAIDGHVRHDEYRDDDSRAAHVASRAALQLRLAADARPALTGPLESARALTSHLEYRD